MKQSSLPLPSALLVLALLLLPAGCLFKPSTVATRTFVLAPAAAAEAPASDTPALGIAPVGMPAYLLRSALALRKGTNEIEYLENALWAERLDRGFQRTLAANLMRLVPTTQVRLTDWRREEVALVLHVVIERFDVDAAGRGTLIAWWRLTDPDARHGLRSGETRLTLDGPASLHDPAAMVTTLNELTARFSLELAKVVRQCAPAASTANDAKAASK